MNTRHTLVSIAVVMFAAGCGGGGANGGFSPLPLPAAPAAPPPAAPPPAAMSLAEKCPTLKGQTLAGGTVAIDDAKLVAASAPQPEYCVVSASFKGSTLRLEARLPTADWNGKLAFIGGGGFDGQMPTATAAQFSESIFTERYATVGTNGGYDYPGATDLNYFKGEFALDDAKLLDFTQQSEHRALPPGKEVIAQFFGTAPTRSYFEGCSMGGHDAMMQAQRFPRRLRRHRGARAGRQHHGPLRAVQPHRQAGARARQHAESGQADAAGQRGARAVRRARRRGGRHHLQARGVHVRCDGAALRGRCGHGRQLPVGCADRHRQHHHFAGRDIGRCVVAHGLQLRRGELAQGLGRVHLAAGGVRRRVRAGLFSDGFVRSFITRDAAFDTSAWNPDQWLARMGVIGGLFSAADPDLGRLHARGAKLIMWNGTNDTSVSARDNAHYYEQVVSTLGAQKADETVELFLAPGVGHCYGGAGPDKVDLLKAMSTWVEQGVPASAQKLVHRKVDAAGATTMARPMCKYPAYPRYKGAGDVNDAGSFDCVN
jgi:hypothetical protein